MCKIGCFTYGTVSAKCSHGVGIDDKKYIDSLHIRKKHIRFFKEKGFSCNYRTKEC